MLLYAAYGSNLDPGRMRATCPRSPMVGTGWLEGWRLTFGGRELGWESVVTTVVEDHDHRTFVALYDVESTDAGTLDELEGAAGGTYRRLHTTAATLNGDKPVWVYVLDGYEGGLPSAWYLAELAVAAERAGAPEDYVAALRKRPTAP